MLHGASRANRPSFKVRESGHPKFYWFDSGVARVAAGIASVDLDSLWKGFAFETLILNELRIYKEVSRKRYGVFYYGTPGAGEIDFLIETRPKIKGHQAEFLTVEVKHSNQWKREYETPFRQLKEFAKVTGSSMTSPQFSSGNCVVTIVDFVSIRSSRIS